MDVNQRLEIERQIAAVAVKGLIAAGYQITIYCDETKILSRTGDVSTILGAMFSSDADALIVYQCQSDADDTWARIGWVELVYRNKGWDVIAGNTENLADALQAATRLIEEMEQKSS